MWDPLLNEFPETVHGFGCMLAVKYLQLVENTYSPDTLGYDLIRDLISVIRARNYVEATSRYNHFHARFEGTSRLNFDSPYVRRAAAPIVRVTKAKAWANRPMDRKPRMYRMYRSPDVP
ncbi:precoat protein/movement protein [Radish leaf curl virus-Hajipur [IN:LabIso:11]]|nr:precoat protein [Radish leaf curl virus-Hajipur [IN:Bih:ok09]]ADZ45280.1 movement/precoat protein [Radish leaf curl virus-Hajipur [IN:Bih06:10]]AFI56228.1 precoat protein/movement protein [Radish leaf curl virus-Hajipur [IN:LabIso:11]]